MDSNWNKFTELIYDLIIEDRDLVTKCIGKGINEVSELIREEYGVIDDGLSCLQAKQRLYIEAGLESPIYWKEIAKKIVELDNQGKLKAMLESEVKRKVYNE